ncbi:MAG TPA: 16S rRNA (cytidine(1402)-2'-O)-methyltransferase [Candidatus Limnocylindrales bacterium]|nr:16S rRNA (cytidine(1402)-2'-O)-methyltransferase [Candidatus Limnocylindrales bacterium]
MAETGGSLYLVATPIGNLGDVTLRALDVLRTVPLVAAEDTRVTRRLFERHAIRSRLISYHARSPERRTEELLAHLASGADLALVTDAGTPGISDPGDDLAARWAALGGRVVPIPGASAVLAAVSATGIAGPRWSFEGFLPRSGAERRARLARVASDERGSVLFERPDRIPATLRDLSAVAGAERPAAVCRELTKRHEEIVRGTLGELAERARAGELVARGEAVIVVGQAPARSPADAAPGGSAATTVEAGRAEVERLVAAGLSRSAAAGRVAAATGLPRRELYRARDED